VYRMFDDCHLRLVVCFNGHWFAIDAIVELGESENYSKELFFYFLITNFSLCEEP